MRSTNRKDRNDQEVFVGDKVIFMWGWFPWKENGKARMHLHTITEGKPFHDGSGKFHEHEPGVLFCMDNYVNNWEGRCLKVTDEYITQFEIPLDSDFFEDDGKAVKITDDINIYGLSDEQFKKIKQDFINIQNNLLWKI